MRKNTIIHYDSKADKAVIKSFTLQDVWQHLADMALDFS